MPTSIILCVISVVATYTHISNAYYLRVSALHGRHQNVIINENSRN
jgi:hypothetical protein